ncbi:uncharacterized protein Dmoj_GI15621 [Drosophila mojavensis]|uniref:Secreted protein n=1 Tax=Drosophila mojavensis TaxID=7230 RepID=B4L3U4_DROMO|nr:uncharacterized protein Dmoj_GI15621 [Drosophila mojavensis]
MNWALFLCIFLRQAMQTKPCGAHGEAHCMRCQYQRVVRKKRGRQSPDLCEQTGVYSYDYEEDD